MSIDGGLHRALERGHSIGCDAIQLFTRNNVRWKAKQRTAEELELYRETQERTGIDPVVAHAIYLINLAAPDKRVHSLSNAAYRDDLARCHEAKIPYLVLHPGSHKGQGLEDGINRIAEGIRSAYAEHPEYAVKTLLENTAGQGDTIGCTFQELAQIAAQAGDVPLGYCLDTAHALASGYDIRTLEGCKAVLAEFDQILGLDKLYCLHLNDSKTDLNSHRDRHAQIGQGCVGVGAFAGLLNDPRLAGRPMLLETPKSEDLHEDVENLALLQSLIRTTRP
jgi:deoxyribonuclease-4